MSYRLIETYGQDELTVLIDGRTYNTPCLVEDDDGLRWYVTSGFMHMIPGHWARAAQAGAACLIAPQEQGWAVITTERFSDLTDASQGRYNLPSGWQEWDRIPTYREVVKREREGVPVAPIRKGFAHLHTHTEFSALDGRSRVAEIVAEVTKDDQGAVASTDHGNCAAHPSLQKECGKAGIKPIFGIEAYFVDDRKRRPRRWWETEQGVVVSEEAYATLPAKEREKLISCSDTAEVRDYHHLILWAKNNEGLRNIWAMSTESYRDGFYYYPKMDWETLRRHSEGVIASTACLRGPVAQPILAGDEDRARSNLGKLLDIFGDDLFLELHANSMPETVTVNEALVGLSREYSVPVVAVVDSHYPTKDDYFQHQAWVAVSTATDVSDETDLFAKDIGLYLKTEAEVRESLSYLPDSVVDEAVNATVRIADQCDASIQSRTVMPIYSKVGGAERDAERLIDLCLSNWERLTTGKPYSQDEAIARFEREMGLLIPKGFPGYFLQVADYCNAMRERKVMVGPGRGSGGGCFVAYLCGITGIDPIEHDLAFERFMTEGRTALPDFDVDFPASKRNVIQDYITGKYGSDHVVRVGTHTSVKNKGILRALASSMKSMLPEMAWKDFDEVSKIITAAESGTAGLGLTWEELWAQEGELLEPYAKAYPQVFEMAEVLVGLLKSYGKHPAGLVVADESLVDSLPLRQGADEGENTQMVTQFAMGDLESMGYIKFDILTLRTLDTIQACVDLIEKRRGHRIDMDSWKDEYLDPQVWDMISDGNTLGVFQVETSTGQRMCKQVRPQNMAEYADVLTLVRPGPTRSGLTKLYLDRRAGESAVSYPDPRLEQVLSQTYGCILYQEQVMSTCMILAGYDSNKADEVRKILGKKKVDLVVSAGREFVEGCVAHGGEREASEFLWEQMAEFAKYSFGKAHAFGYAVLSYWTAWLKVHYPVEFFTSVLSTVDQERIPEFVSEARRFGFKILPPDINESGRGFQAVGLGVRYGLDSLKGVGEAALTKILPGQPYASFDDFRARSGVDSGVTRTLARIGAFDSLGENRRGLETLLEAEKTGDALKCQRKSLDIVNVYNSLPCTFDWDTEPAPINKRTGRELKKKDPPKKCTRACRQYLAPEPFDPSTVEEYTEKDVRDIEMEILRIHLSTTEFDRMDPEDRAFCLEQAELLEVGPSGPYYIAATVIKARRHIDRNGNEMGFLGLQTERGDIDVTAFKTDWAKYKAHLRVGVLGLFEIEKNDRGMNLRYMSVVT